MPDSQQEPTRSTSARTKRLIRGTSASRQERLRQAYAGAGADPAYQAEMEEIDRAFGVTVGDGLT
jgi:hypothetical protein